MNPLKHIKSKLGEMRYNVGFISTEDITLPQKERFKKINWIKLGAYKDGWFADPFILNVSDEKIELLAEEWIYKDNKGRISKLVIDKHTYKLLSIVVVLELETHLSFPLIYEENGIIYVCPENYQSGCVNIYTYDRNTAKLVNPTTIINKPLIDTQLFKLNGKYYALGVERKTGAMEDTRILKIYESDSLCGQYKEIQTIENTKNIERGAGNIFLWKDRIIRPVQNCEGGYGLSTILYELIYKNKEFNETELYRIEPNRSSFMGLCLHTFNIKENLCVIDGQEYIYYRLARTLKKITSIFH